MVGGKRKPRAASQPSHPLAKAKGGAVGSGVGTDCAQPHWAVWLGGWEVTRCINTLGWVPKEEDTPGSPSRPLKHLRHPLAHPKE